MFEGPEKKFQKHIFDYLVRNHKYAVLEQSEITDTEYYFAEDHIMRTFTRLREILATHKDLARKLEEMEKKYDAQFKVVFDTIRQLMAPPPEPKKRKIGFIARERSAQYRTHNRRAIKK